MIRRLLNVFTNLAVLITTIFAPLILLCSEVQWSGVDEWLFGFLFIILLLSLGVGVGWMAIVVWIRR